MAVAKDRDKHGKEPIITRKFLAYTAVVVGNIVKIGGGGDGTVVPSTAGDESVGIALNTVTDADIVRYLDATGNDYMNEAVVEVDVMIQGVAPVLAGGEVAMDAWVTSDGTARVVTATIYTDACIGICMDGATGAGEQTHILIHRIPIDARQA